MILWGAVKPCPHCSHELPHVGAYVATGPNLVVCVGDERHMLGLTIKEDIPDMAVTEANVNRPVCDAIHRGGRT